jgi:hypothetical protein
MSAGLTQLNLKNLGRHKETVLAGGPAGLVGIDFFNFEKLSLPRAMWPHDTRVHYRG